MSPSERLRGATVKYLAEFDPAQCGGHALRYAMSLQWLEPLLTPGAVVLDFGRGSCPGQSAVCPFDAVLPRLFPVDLRGSGKADLRYPLPIDGETADGVLLMETIEHLKDREESDVENFGYSGIRNVLSEARRILKPDGWLFLTTPNLSRYTCAWNLVRGESAHWVLAHCHEFGYCELQRFLTDAGFTIERIETPAVWEPLECPHILKAVMEHLAPDVPRGDCIFVLARKPEAQP
jgi:SAM-dependent methyltransferase